ncbi:Nucleoporin nup84, partial [Ascosphaera atra]
MRPPTSRLHQVEYIELDDSDEEPVSLESEQGDEEELRDEEIEEDYDLVSAGQSGDQGDDAISISSGISAPAISDDFADVLNPLRNTADRVATSIELFAQNLDKFKRQSLQPNDPEAFRVACDLVKKYRTIAEHSVQDLSKNNALARAKQLASRATGVASASNLANEEQAIRWKLEAETWDLLLELLDMHNPDKLQKSKETMKSAFEGLHRYSSDQDVWRKFLEVDHYALENVVILKWLEKSTRSLPHNALDFTIADLKRRADRGQGVWTRGWLNSKETIKAAKRFRANPEPLQPGDPAMTSPMLATDQSASQVTQLDPDAVTRQQRILQRQDELFEQATWLTIWKMLREGQGWSKIRQWASERLENWRAVSVCGAATKSNNDSFDDSLTRMMSCRSLDSWRLACHALANNPQVDQFERAVYALLCGETEPAYAACQGWSDHLYVYLNSVILTRYRDFCRQFQRKLTNSTGETVICKIADPDLEGLQKHLEAIRQNEKVKAEARNPYRTIQSAIISHQYDVFFYRQANALTKIAADSKRPTLVPK